MATCKRLGSESYREELIESCESKDQQIIKLTVRVDELQEWVWQDRTVMFICGLVVGLGIEVVWLLWL